MTPYKVSKINPKIFQVLFVPTSLLFVILNFKIYLSNSQDIEYLFLTIVILVIVAFLIRHVLKLSTIYLQDSTFYIDNIVFGKKEVPASEFIDAKGTYSSPLRYKIYFKDGKSYHFLNDIFTKTDGNYDQKLTLEIKNHINY